MLFAAKRGAAILLTAVALSVAVPAHADDHPSEPKAGSLGTPANPPRKVKMQVQPIFPDMARQMNLKGTVRLEIEIAADGTVRSTKALGGHPVLIQSAEQAVRKWRYEPGPVSKTVVEFNFHQD